MRSKTYTPPDSEALPDNIRKDAEVAAGNFVYYVVAVGTNIRARVDGVVVVYKTKALADKHHDISDGVEYISVAEYNRLYGDVMKS